MRLNALLAGLCLLLSPPLSAQGDDSRLHVLTTFAPIDSLTRNVAGDAAITEMLMTPGSDPHNFALSPKDLKKVASADVVVSNGLGIDRWMERAISAGAKRNVVRISSGEGLADGDNPHVWLDPVRAIQQVEAICHGLVAADPIRADTFRRNTAAFVERLRKLHNDFVAVSKTIHHKRVIAFHDSFRYFAQRYGFEIVAVYQKIPGREPPPRELNELRKLVRNGGAQFLFLEPGYSPEVFQSISSDSKVRVVMVDPIEVGQPAAELYETAMRANLRSLQAALDE